MSVNSNCFSLVIFDLDGTLIDAFDDIAAAANFVRARNNLAPLSTDDVKLHVAHGARHLVSGVLDSTDDAYINDNLQALVVYYEGLTESKATIYDGVIETLQFLREQNIRTAIASNKPHSVAVKVVDSLGLAPYFDIVQGEEAGITRKPAPDVLHIIMLKAGVPQQRTLMVGDTDVDIQCAHSAGVRVAAVTYGQHSESRLIEAGADFLLHKMSDLKRVIGS